MVRSLEPVTRNKMPYLVPYAGHEGTARLAMLRGISKPPLGSKVIDFLLVTFGCSFLIRDGPLSGKIPRKWGIA